MSPLKKNLLTVFTILSFLVFAIASGRSRKGMTIQNDQIPPDFRSFNGTLLVIGQTNQWNKYMTKHFDENYSGKYLVTNSTELGNKYSDTEKYRYVLSRELTIVKEVHTNKTAGVTERLVMEDRKTGKKYFTNRTKYFGKLLDRYSSALNEELSK